jgi:hypothetical protein
MVYKNYWAKDPDFEVVDEYLKYYHETYDDCRSAFLDKSQQFSQNSDSVKTGRFIVDSKIDDDLTIDWCFIPSKTPNEKLLIITSGLHGIEGYAGSAVQLMFMDKIMNSKQLKDVSVLFIHAMNPFGFKYRRKVTENNVDLNRNCAINFDLYESKNDGYEKLIKFLMPKSELNIGSLNNRFFHLVAIRKIIQESMPVLRQAALQGQYQFDKGIYYGGKKFEPQINQVKPFLKSIMKEYEIILNLDLHTGYGERGKLHLFLNPVEDKKVEFGIKSIFKDVSIDWGNSNDFYTIKGEYIGWSNSLADGALCIPMFFEYGTLDSQKTFGSLKSIQIMINENQGTHFGYKNLKNEKKIKKLFSEMYYPESEVWRSKVISDSYKLMRKMIDNYSSYSPE